MMMVRAELKKLCTLTSATVSCILVPVGLAALSARAAHRALSAGGQRGLLSASTVDAGFGHLIFGTIGVVVIGVVIMSSEYARNAQKVGRSRQLTTTISSSDFENRRAVHVGDRDFRCGDGSDDYYVTAHTRRVR